MLPPYLDLLDKERLDDFASKKVYKISLRGAWRDYVDLFFLLKWKKYSINDLISLAEKKFQNEFNPKLFLEQLVYYKDIEITDTIFIKEKYTPVEIKSFLEEQTRLYLKTILSV